jgi:hypothetical protein
MMAHKRTSAVFPQRDKLISNMMGILAEAQVGSAMTFPMCGFDSDDWVPAFARQGTAGEGCLRRRPQGPRGRLAAGP